MARFLKGLPVRAVWCEMRQSDNTWSRPRLILATETDLSAQEVVEIYALRLWASFPLMDIAPWRKGAMITAGLFAQWKGPRQFRQRSGS